MLLPSLKKKNKLLSPSIDIIKQSSSLICSIAHMIHITKKWQICIVSVFQISPKHIRATQLKLFAITLSPFLQNMNEFKGIILSSQLPQNVTNPSRLRCQQYSCVDCRNLKIAAKLQEFDCNISNHVIGVVFSPFFPSKYGMSHFRAEVLLYWSHTVLKWISWSRSALLSGVWGLVQASTQSRSVRDLLLTESNPPAWPLSQTQQAAGAHTYRNKHVAIYRNSTFFPHICM